VLAYAGASLIGMEHFVWLTAVMTQPTALLLKSA